MSKRKFALLLILPSVIFVEALLFYPGIYLFWLSGRKFHYLTSEFVGIKNFLTLFADNFFWQDLLRSLRYAIGSSAIFFPVGLALALCLNRIRRGITFFRGVIILPWAIPPVISAMLWRWMLNSEYGAVNDLLLRVGLFRTKVTWLSIPSMANAMLIFTDAWIRIPFVVLLVLAALQSIPKDLYESAEIDGASLFQQFIYITFP